MMLPGASPHSSSHDQSTDTAPKTADAEPATTVDQLRVARQERAELQASLVIEWCTPVLHELGNTETMGTESIPRKPLHEFHHQCSWSSLLIETISAGICGVEQDDTYYFPSDMPGSDGDTSEYHRIESLTVSNLEGKLCFNLREGRGSWDKVDHKEFMATPQKLIELLSCAHISFSPAEGTQLPEFVIAREMLPPAIATRFAHLIEQTAELWIQLVKDHETKRHEKLKQDAEDKLVMELTQQQEQNKALRALLVVATKH